MRVLYITYFGVQKHLIQTQVVPYLRELAQHGCEITLLSFEERFADAAAEKRERKRLRALLTGYGIDWRPLRYHKRPSLPATMYDVVAGVVYGSWLVLRKRIEVVHARNHVPAVIALWLKKVFGARLLFDLRGVMAEEYVDAGRWKEGGVPYRLTKWTETRALCQADAIVMLTRKIRDVLAARSPGLRSSSAYIEIIPCCVETEKYASASREEARRRLGLEGKLVLAYVGSLGGWYMNEEMCRLFLELRRQDARAHFLIVTQSDAAMMTAPLQRLGASPSEYALLTVTADEVPGTLVAADVAVSFIRPCFSKQSSSPTKIGEYLAAGVPIITNKGIGDIDELISSHGVGVLVEDFSAAGYERAVKEIRKMMMEGGEDTRARCRATAAARLSLAAVGAAGYLRVYEHLGFRPCEQITAIPSTDR